MKITRQAVGVIGFSMMFSMILVLSGYADVPEAVSLRNEALKLQQQGYYQAALEKVKEAIKLDGQYAAAYNDMGVLLEETQQTAEAIEAYQKAIALAPSYGGAYTNLAAIYESQGDLKSALEAWRKRSKLGDSQDPWRAQALKKVSELEDLLHGSAQQAGGYEFSSVRNRKLPKEESADRQVKRLISEAKKDSNQYRYLDALEKLEKAKRLTEDPAKLNDIEEALTGIREDQIQYDTARASAEVGLYKQAKMVEVEHAWYPPTPEPDAGKRSGGFGAAISAKTPARLMLEKKANQIIPSIDFNDAQLKDVIEFLAASNDINIVIDEEVVADASGVTVHLKNIPLVEALDIILRTKGLKYRFEENIIWITTGEKLAQEDLVVKVYDVQDLVNKLHDFPSEPFDIQDILKDSSKSGDGNNDSSKK